MPTFHIRTCSPYQCTDSRACTSPFLESGFKCTWKSNWVVIEQCSNKFWDNLNGWTGAGGRGLCNANGNTMLRWKSWFFYLHRCCCVDLPSSSNDRSRVIEIYTSNKTDLLISINVDCGNPCDIVTINIGIINSKQLTNPKWRWININMTNPSLITF